MKPQIPAAICTIIIGTIVFLIGSLEVIPYPLNVLYLITVCNPIAMIFWIAALFLKLETVFEK